MHSEIPETKIATPTTSEIVGTRLEKPSKIDSKPNLKLTSEDYLTKAGLGLEQVCKDLVASGKVTKELFLEARKFCKSNDVSEMAGGVLLAEKIESIVKTGHVSVATSQEIISLAREILGLEKPVIAGTRLETPLKPEITGTRLERKVAQAPVIKELKDEREDELGFERPEKKEGNNSGIFVLTGVIGCILLMGIIWIITLGGKKGEPIVANSESSNEESKANKKAKQMELVKLKQEDLGQGIKLEMVLISAGKFMMGSPEFEEGRFLNENQHEVVLTRPFYMGKYEVTQEQWEAVMGYNPSRTKGAKLPVTDVSWEDCQEFIKKLNTKTNGGYRLPTEAEWEYSCRAGTTSAYSFGHSLTKSNANIDGYKISPVGSYEPNVFGLFDMHGNVWEWCEDWYENYLTTTLTDPKGSATGKSRMLRGGSFNSNVSEARSSFRDNGTPAARSYSLGFRLARTADVKAAVESPTPKPDPAETIPTLANSLVSPFTEAKAKEVQKKVAKDLQNEVEEKEDLGKGIKLEMVLIPSGKFKMGSPTSEKGRSDNETQHEVTLTRPYYMGKYEVTQEQWESVMGENPSSTKGTNLPVTNVSWEDCQAFIKKLNAKTNGGYRLPTEAEWEYACRAGTTTAYSVGDNLWQSVANIDGNSIKVVGSYKPNAFGLYDMHGNVWEWCEDCKADYPVESVTDPKGPATGISRVMRGGSYGSSDSGARSSFRNSTFAPIFRYSSEGFRLARTADVKTAVLPSTPKPAPAESMPTVANSLVSPFTEAKAKEVQKEVAKILQREVEVREDLGNGIKLEMVLIPAGKFMMGSPESEEGRNEEEKQHEVIITNPFYMGKYEVTQEQWDTVMGNNSIKIDQFKKSPVTQVSWEDCQDFVKKLNAKTNGGYRLPTEAEWEYSCRSGTNSAFAFGDNLTDLHAKFCKNIVYSAQPRSLVGIYPPNAWGLHDMHGNVWEWCGDRYGAYPAGTVTDPKGPATGTHHVLRGGSASVQANECRSAIRGEASLDRPNPSGKGRYEVIGDFGFRLARTADVKTAVLPSTPKTAPAESMPTVANSLVSPFTEAKAKEVQKEVAKILQREVKEKEDLGKDIKLEMVLIPAGKFKMGSPTSEKGRSDNETQHEVTLTKPYYMGKYEVTQEQWESVMGNNPSSTKGAKLPVTNVSWEDCQEFIKMLNAKTKGGYRLPTEAEWEYSCRAGTTTAYSFGDSLTNSDANIKGSSIKVVGSYKPNAFGLFDMHGNVWEWCEDWKAYYQAGAVTDPKGSVTGICRVLRGGSFDNSVSYARSSSRYDFAPTVRPDDYGFRLARNP